MSRTQQNNTVPYTASIYVVGPSSTGKTTLCNSLAKRLDLSGPAYVTEVARRVMKTDSFTREHVGNVEMQRAIMEAQLLREEEGRMCRTKVCDRSAVDPIVYAMLTASSEEEAQQRRKDLIASEQFQLVLEQYRRSVFVLLTPVPEWLVDDGIRTVENQTKCSDVFKQTLRDFGICYKELGPDMRSLAERTTVVMGLARL